MAISLIVRLPVFDRHEAQAFHQRATVMNSENARFPRRCWSVGAS
jgi:hypothetical protein